MAMILRGAPHRVRAPLRALWLGGVLTAAVVTGCSDGAPSGGSPSAAPRAADAERPVAPEFELPTLTGTRVRLSDHRGQVVMLNFWATWCGPCRVEAPSLQRLYAGAEGPDFELLAVSLDATPEPVRRFVQQYGLQFPVLLDSERAVAARYGVVGVPLTLLIDRAGRIAQRVDGARDWDAPGWREALAQLAAE